MDRLKRGEKVPLEEVPPLPRLSLRIRGQKPRDAFEGLLAEVPDSVEGRLVLRCLSDDSLVQALLVLNFAHERLEFEPYEQLALRDDGSPRPFETDSIPPRSGGPYCSMASWSSGMPRAGHFLGGPIPISQ